MGSSGFNTAGVEESGLAISSILFFAFGFNFLDTTAAARAKRSAFTSLDRFIGIPPVPISFT